MHKTATINARIDPFLKEKAENILHKVGLSAAEAVRLFYTQICLQKGLPFEAKIPNKLTLKAMADADTGKTHKVRKIKDIFEDL
jgi:DNA-damage-inducible protein J